MTRDERRPFILLAMVLFAVVWGVFIRFDQAANAGKMSAWLIVSWVAPIVGCLGLSILDWYDTSHKDSTAENAVGFLTGSIPAFVFFGARELHSKEQVLGVVVHRWASRATMRGNPGRPEPHGKSRTRACYVECMAVLIWAVLFSIGLARLYAIEPSRASLEANPSRGSASG